MIYLKEILKRFALFRKKKEVPKVDYKLDESYRSDSIVAYTFNNPLYLPKCRFALLGQALNDSQLNMTKDDAAIFFEKMKMAANSGAWSDVMTLINTMEFYMSQHTSTNTLLAVGKALIILQGEPTDRIDPEWMQKKEHLFKTDLDFRGFFLRSAYVYLLTFSNQSIESFQVVDYLNSPIVKMSEKQFQTLLTENTEKGLKETKT
jgi:hypothetical protein